MTKYCYRNNVALSIGAIEIEQFLTHLAIVGRVSASTQTQTLWALLFLYKHLLKIDSPALDAVRAKRPKMTLAINSSFAIIAIVQCSKCSLTTKKCSLDYVAARLQSFRDFRAFRGSKKTFRNPLIRPVLSPTSSGKPYQWRVK